MADGNGNGFVITKETWEHMPEKQKAWIMFETMQSVNARLKKLERWNKVMSAIGGVIGGILAHCGFKMGGAV